jgi:hypothetical protein
VASSHASQVYGGAISVTVGPFVRSFMGTGSSYISCGAVNCEKCGLLVDGASMQNSLALSNTYGTLAAPSFFGCVNEPSETFCLMIFSGNSHGAFVRVLLQLPRCNLHMCPRFTAAACLLLYMRTYGASIPSMEALQHLVETRVFQDFQPFSQIATLPAAAPHHSPTAVRTSRIISSVHSCV